MRVSTDEMTRKVTATSGDVSGVLKRTTGEIEKALLGVSAEVTRGFTAKAEEMTANISQRGNDLKKVLDDRTGVFLSTFGAQGQKFTDDIDRITRDAVQSIDSKGIAFTKAMVANSQEITGLINSVFLIGSMKALVATPYGRLLIVKVALFVAMVGLALINRFGGNISRTAEFVGMERSALHRKLKALGID